MAKYYVRKSGSDGNSGTSPSQAKLTAQAGQNLLAAGGTDTLYIGSGDYRETLTPNKNGVGVGSEHQIIADIFGEFTGDRPGPVRLTTHNSDDDLTTERANVLQSCDVSHVRIIGFVLHGGGNGFANYDAVVHLQPSANRSNLVIEDCLLDPAGGSQVLAKEGSFSHDVTLRRCIIAPWHNWNSYQPHAGSLTLTMESCYDGGGADSTVFYSNSAGTFTIAVNKCFFGPTNSGQSYFDQFAGTLNATIRNSQFRMGRGNFTANGPTITKSYNRYEGDSPPALDTGEIAGWVGDLLLWSLLKPNVLSYLGVEGTGVSTGAPALDILARTVPQGTGYDIGPAENGVWPMRDTSIFGTASPSALASNGQRMLHRIQWGVQAGQWNTFGIKMRYNSAYTATPKPRLTIKADPVWGPVLGLQNDTYVEADANALNAFYQYLASGFIASDGVAEIWLESFSMEAGAKAWFDDFSGPSFAA